MLGYNFKRTRLSIKYLRNEEQSDKQQSEINELIELHKQGYLAVVILDNAPIHKSEKFIANIARWKEMYLYIYFLPPYSPELNKIEILWKFIKYQWIPLDAYQSFQNPKERLNETLLLVG